jgi:dihydroorotate dehydrogenase (NAD+) catalytic subunit
MTRAYISPEPVGTSQVQARVSMQADLAGVELVSPVLTASGCAASGKELDSFFDITAIGGVITKSIMLKPRSGRPTPRMAETPSGMLNSIGLQGPGVESFIEHDLNWLNERGATTIVSIAGETADEYGRIAQKLRSAGGFAALEVNISCPNVADRGQVFACQADSAAAVIQAVRRNSDGRVPIIAKLSPDVTSIVEITDSVVRAGATAVTLINTTLGMVINTKTMRPALAGITGGLSGPAIRPIAVRCVYQVRQAFPQLPIIGTGGIRTGHDALEMILAGANAVSVGTAIFNDPSAPMRIHRELQEELAARGFTRLVDAVGYAHRDVVEEEEVSLERDSVSASVPEQLMDHLGEVDDQLADWDFLKD